jgi:O-acetylhomoserine (thiol)-lyase
MKTATALLHAGHRADPTSNAVAVPIHMTTSYQFDSTAHAADLFALKQFGNIYTRVMNPTTDGLEKRIAAMEGGAAALAVASGQAATMMAIQNIAAVGDNIVSSTDLYGGSWNLVANTFATIGIEVRFVDPSDPENFRRATDDRTRAWYGETLPTPKLRLFPIAEVAAIANELGVPLIMDNTAAPLLCKPLAYGAHIVVYSTTKYIGGHGQKLRCGSASSTSCRTSQRPSGSLRGSSARRRTRSHCRCSARRSSAVPARRRSTSRRSTRPCRQTPRASTVSS